MSSAVQVTIAGITGKFAGLLTKHLLTKPQVSIHGIARNPDKVSPELKDNPKVKIFQANADDASSLQAALKGSNVAVCCYLGDKSLMVDGQKALIDACIAENVPRYIASDWCLDYRGLQLGDHPLKDPMKVVRAYIEEKERETNGAIKGVHVLNGAFMEVIFSFAQIFDVRDPQSPVLRSWGSLDEPREATTYDDAARYTAEIAIDGTATGFFNVIGDSKSTNQLGEVYESVYGVKPRVESLGTLEELHTTMHKAFQANPANVRSWMQMFYSYYMLNGSTLLRRDDNSRYPGFGHAATFEDIMKKYDSPQGLTKIAFQTGH